MRHTRAIALLSLLTLLATAPLADARKPRPYVKSVAPLRVAVGDTMTVQGFYFRRGYAENTVVFMGKGGRVSYVRSEHSSRRRLKVIVPKKVQRLLPRSSNGLRAPAKFRIKVIARRIVEEILEAGRTDTIGELFTPDFYSHAWGTLYGEGLDGVRGIADQRQAMDDIGMRVGQRQRIGETRTLDREPTEVVGESDFELRQERRVVEREEGRRQLFAFGPHQR